MAKNQKPNSHRIAERHLASAHPVFARLIEQIGPCTMRPHHDLFEALIGTIISQQISTKAANSIAAKVRDLCNGKKITPTVMLKFRDARLQSCGLSAAKRRTILTLARMIVKGELDLKKIRRADDDYVSAQLLQVCGIGPWSVDMILLFGLGRTDVLPVGDFGFRAAVKDQFGLKAMPAADELTKLAEPWRPYRSIATWYMWRSRGPVVRSD